MRQVSYCPPLIGRKRDFELLKSRLEQAGLTIVAAEPMMGKSYLLSHFKKHVLSLGKHSIGSAQGTAHSSLFKDAFVDLYSKAISELSKKQQALELFEKIKRNWPKALLKTLPGIKKLLDHDGGGAEDLSVALVDGLLGIQEETSKIIKVDYQEAKQLAEYIYKLNEQPQILILDALDQLADPNEQCKLIEECTHNIFRGEGWPPIHIFVCLRSPSDESSVSEQAALKWAQLAKTHASTKLHTLNPWHPDESEWMKMANYLNENISGFQDFAGESHDYAKWLTLPGMVENILIEQPKTQEQLLKACTDCVDLTYSQLLTALTKVQQDSEELFSLALQLSMLPELSELLWRSLSGCWSQNLSIDLETLRLEKVLQRDRPVPMFGHTTRYKYIRDLCFKQWPSRCALLAEELALQLFSSINSINEDSQAIGESILGLQKWADSDDSSLNLIIGLTSTFFGNKFIPNLMRIKKFRQQNYKHCTTPLSMYLCNALTAAKEEENIELRDALLVELRELAAAQLYNSRVQSCLSIILFKTLNDAKTEENFKLRDSMLAELRELAAVQLDNPEVQTQLAYSLYNTLNDAKTEENFKLRDTMLVELRELASVQLDNPEVQTKLSRGLFNTLNSAEEEKNLKWRDALLVELRELAAEKLYNTEVQRSLAMGLFNTLNSAKEEGNPEWRDELLMELRELATAQPDNPHIQSRLSRSLLNTLSHAKEEEKFEWRDSLLVELRELAAAQLDNPEVQSYLAMGLFNTLNDARVEENLEWRDALLVELRELAVAQLDNSEVYTTLAKGLVNTLYVDKAEGGINCRDALLVELRELVAEQLDNPEGQSLLAIGLGNTLIAAKMEENLEWRDALLVELRELAAAQPDNSEVQAILATSLAKTLIAAKQ